MNINNINSSTPKIYSSSSPVSGENSKNTQVSSAPSDAFTSSGNIKDDNLIKNTSFNKTEKTSQISLASSEYKTPEKALEISLKTAGSLIPGTAGAVAGVTIDALLKHKDEINKGFVLSDSYLDGYYQRRVQPYQARPTYTPSDDEHLYRGMLLNVDDIANIMENGLETRFNTWQTAGGKGVYFSSSEREADDYIFQAASKKDGLGVVVEVEKGDFAQEVVDPVYNSTKTIYKAPGDVPKEKITNIFIRGEYGLESLSKIIEKAENGEIKSNEKWVSQFDKMFDR